MNQTTTQANPTLGTNQPQVDPTALQLSRAIRRAEGSGYNQIVREPNATTSFGAYGWNENNFQTWAKEFGLDPNDTSETNQDKLAYTRIKHFLDKGLSQSEIAAIWNGAKKENGKYKANNPEYVNKVKSYYEQSTKQVPYTTSLSIPGETRKEGTESIYAPKEQGAPSLGQKLSSRAEGIVGALKGEDASNIGSKALQVAGGVAGGLGDVVSAGLSKIPGMKQVEGLIGKGVSKLVETKKGTELANKVSEFIEKNPQAAKNIEAVIDIASAIPILKGLSVAKNITFQAGARVLKPMAENSFKKNMTAAISRGVRGQAFIAKNPNIAAELLKDGAIPTIENGKYVVKDLVSNSWNKINVLNKQVDKQLTSSSLWNPKSLQGLISKGGTLTSRPVVNAQSVVEQAIRSRFPDSTYSVKHILQESRKLIPHKGGLLDKFASGRASVKEVNALRSALDKAARSVYGEPGQETVRKEIAAALSESMRNYVKTTVPETAPLFDAMSRQFDIQKALSYINGKSVTQSLPEQILVQGATVAGEAAGAMTGVPIAGALAGRTIAGGQARKLGERVTEGILKRNMSPIVSDPFQAGRKIVTGGLAAKVTEDKKNQAQIP